MTADDEARAAARHEWGRRVEAEYRSAAFTQHFTLWLIQAGAPPDLLEAGLRIVCDELDHAALSFAVFAAAGGQAPPSLNRAALRLPAPPSATLLETALLEHGLRLFCIGETVAVRLFSPMRAAARQPDACAALDRILKDEVFHRDFGWTLLEWLLDGPQGDEFRAQAQRMLPDLLRSVRTNYGGSEVDGCRAGEDVSEAARAWGLIAQREYLAAVDETFERDYAPRLAALGLRMPQHT